MPAHVSLNDFPVFADIPERKGATPNAFDDFFESGVGAWTAINFALIAAVGGRMMITTDAAGGAGPSSEGGGASLRAAIKALPSLSGDWTVTAKVHMSTRQGNLNFNQVGVCITDANSGIGGKFVAMLLQDSGRGAYLKKHNGATDASPATTTITAAERPYNYAYFRIKHVTSTDRYSYQFSWDGVHWEEILLESTTAFLGAAPHYFGIYKNAQAVQSNTALAAICEFVKLTVP